MKKFRYSAIGLFIITIIILFFVLKDDFNAITNLLFTVNIWWLLIAFLCFLIYIFMRSLTLQTIIKKNSKHVKLFTIYKQFMIDQFLCGITPFSIGGEPYRVYMLSKEGVGSSKAVNIVLQEFIVYQIVIIILGTLSFIINLLIGIVPLSSFIYKFLLLGYLINLMVGVLLVFICFSKKFNKFIGKKVIGFLSKIKIIKDKTKMQDIWFDKVDDFHQSALIFKRNPVMVLKTIFYDFIGVISFYAIPIFVFYSLGISSNITILTVVLIGIKLMLMGSIIPIPGGLIGVEYGFLTLFGVFISGPKLSASLLIWRTITYYLPVIIGGIIINFYKGGINK